MLFEMRILSTLILILLAVVVLAIAFLYKGDLPAAFVDQKYSNEFSEFLTTDDGSRVHYRDQGAKDAALPVVLIHGSNASLHTWEPWINELKGQYRIITLDLPGHGLTGKVPTGEYGRAAQLGTVSAVVDHLGIDTFILGGNSMGGGVTWRYALENPDRVLGMILVDASGLASWRNDPPPDASEAGDTPLAFQLLRQSWFRAIARYLDPRMLVEQGLRSAYNNSPVVTEQLIDRYYELALREGTREATLEMFADYSRSSAAEPDLGQLDQPTLVMWGARDSLIPVAYANRFAEVLPNATVVIYDDLGHTPMEEAPTRTVRDVEEFLRSFSENFGENLDASMEESNAG